MQRAESVAVAVQTGWPAEGGGLGFHVHAEVLGLLEQASAARDAQVLAGRAQVGSTAENVLGADVGEEAQFAAASGPAAAPVPAPASEPVDASEPAAASDLMAASGLGFAAVTHALAAVPFAAGIVTLVVTVAAAVHIVALARRMRRAALHHLEKHSQQGAMMALGDAGARAHEAHSDSDIARPLGWRRIWRRSRKLYAPRGYERQGQRRTTGGRR